MKASWIALGALLITGQVHAVNKCIGPDGKAVFQDAPCAGRGEALVIKPSRGSAPTAAPTAGSGAPQSGAPSTEAQRLEANIAASQKERRLRELNDILVPGAAGVVDQNKAACEQQAASLERSKYTYVQNLYGKTHAAQISAELSELATKCDRKDRELRERLEKLRKECSSLGGSCG